MNAGYQKDDVRLNDYELWSMFKLDLRGPQLNLELPYFSAIGAAQTFGRFVEDPYPALLSDICGVGSLNLGFSGAGPSFFLRRPEIIDAVNEGLFAIIQVMSGRSVANSLVTPAENQGTLIFKYRKPNTPKFAEVVYKTMLGTLSPTQLELIRVENRAVLASETIELLKSIKVPKILLYWSTRNPDYQENLTSLRGYWGAFPHFVDSKLLEAIRPFADHFVQVIGAKGLPQPLYDRHTGEAVLMWPEEAFPGLHHRHRHANLYYPSPEMHEQAAWALGPICLEMVRPPDGAAPYPRNSPTIRCEQNLGCASVPRPQISGELSVTVQTSGPTAFECPYDQYDPETLGPLNQNTVLRVAGLGWTEEDFAGKSVLDVGANTGFLSIQAVKLGAKEVHATEVVQPAIDLIDQIAKKHLLPIRTSRIDFSRLQPATDAADVVLFMEVIQYVMRSGDVSVGDVIGKLIRLTRQTLYIEFPWDANDPQIQKKTALTNETFNAHLILMELSRYFRTVKFVRFMRYYGFTHSKGNRVLLKCTDLRSEAELLSKLDDTESFDIPISGWAGMKRTYLLQSKVGLMIAKVINGRNFFRLDSTLQTKIFEELIASGPKHVVLPIKVAGEFVTQSGGLKWVVFPLVGAITKIGDMNQQLRPEEILTTARKVCVELNSVSSATISELQDKGFGLSLSFFKGFTDEFLQSVFVVPELKAVYEASLTLPLTSLDSLIHQDLHAGNMIRDGDVIRVVDLDAMQLGTVCSDLIKAAIWYNCSSTQIEAEIKALEQTLNRSIQASEYAYGVGLWLSWLAGSGKQVARYTTGLSGAAAYYHNRWNKRKSGVVFSGNDLSE